MREETVQNLGVVSLVSGRQAGENVMRWRVAIELMRGDGTVHTREVAIGSDESAGSVVKPLGLTLADAKALLAAVQCHVVEGHARVAEIMADRCTAEYERVVARLGAPYRRARGLRRLRFLDSRIKQRSDRSKEA